MTDCSCWTLMCWTSVYLWLWPNSSAASGTVALSVSFLLSLKWGCVVVGVSVWGICRSKHRTFPQLQTVWTCKRCLFVDGLHTQWDMNSFAVFYVAHLRVSHLSTQVRTELQSCVSRQLEALRCREVWLLSQLELLEQVKTETLQQQLHQLHWVIMWALLATQVTAWLLTCYLLLAFCPCSSSGVSLMQSATSSRTPTPATTWTTSWPVAWRSKYWAACLFLT